MLRVSEGKVLRASAHPMLNLRGARLGEHLAQMQPLGELEQGINCRCNPWNSGVPLVLLRVPTETTG